MESCHSLHVNRSDFDSIPIDWVIHQLDDEIPKRFKVVSFALTQVRIQPGLHMDAQISKDSTEFFESQSKTGFSFSCKHFSSPWGKSRVTAGRDLPFIHCPSVTATVNEKQRLSVDWHEQPTAQRRSRKASSLCQSSYAQVSAERPSHPHCLGDAVAEKPEIVSEISFQIPVAIQAVRE
jgi:hypothetical protein